MLMVKTFQILAVSRIWGCIECWEKFGSGCCYCNMFRLDIFFIKFRSPKQKESANQSTSMVYFSSNRTSSGHSGFFCILHEYNKTSRHLCERQPGRHCTCGQGEFEIVFRCDLDSTNPTRQKYKTKPCFQSSEQVRDHRKCEPCETPESDAVNWSCSLTPTIIDSSQSCL